MFTDPAVVAVGLYSLLALFAVTAAYFSLFSQFAPWDDEGTLLVTLKSFVHGHVLYRDIYSEYGPFYYELFGGLFSLTGQAVTTDASRSIVVVIWVASSLMYGVAAQRLTGRLLLGLAGAMTAFTVLYALAGTPMHPEGLCVLLLAGFTLLAVSGPSRHRWAGVGCGALLAALALTKVNLGAYGVAAVALAAVLTVWPLYRRRWLRWLIIAAFLAMPVAITARDLSTSWVREFALLEMLTMGSVIAAAWQLRPYREKDEGGVMRWLVGAGTGFAIAFVAIIVVILLTGPTPSDVFKGMIVEAVRVRDVLVLQFPFPTAALDWGIATLAASALAAWWRLRGQGSPRLSPWPGLLRALAGLVIWFTVSHITPLSIGPAFGNPDTLPMLLAWVAVLPPAAATPESPFKRFLRVLLPALAIAETLQVYPVAGAQMSVAALTFVPVGALCLADALVSLKAWSAERGTIGLERFGAVALAVTLALVGMFSLDSILRPLATNAQTYRNQQALPFAGATALHLPAAEVETYSRLVELLHSNHCTTFIGYPNIDSLYIWSGIEPPLPSAPGAWMKALDDEQQQRVVNELRASPHPCAIRSEGRAELWLHGEAPPDSPLVNYIFNDFHTVDTVGEFEFQLPGAGVGAKE